MVKKRYDNLVSNNQSLKRIFSGSNYSKYQTLGKFLPSFSNQKVVFSNKNDDVTTSDTDLDLMDQLVSQAIINRDNNPPTDNNQGLGTTGRAKEILRTEVAESAPKVEEVAEPKPESQPEALSNPELVELSKEIQEVSQENKEQREQAMIKEKQQEISNLAVEATAPVAVSNKPVVILPITAKSAEEAKFKSTKYSIKWLIEWCKKVAKMFSGAVVYKEEVDYE